MKIEVVNQKLVVTGIALLLFGILIAVVSQSMFSYIFGVLGLFLTIIGCLEEKQPYDRRKT